MVSIILVLCIYFMVPTSLADFDPRENADFPFDRYGQETPINVSDPRLYNATEFAVNYINYLAGYDESGHTFREALYQLDRATVQVVSGWMYRVTAHIGVTFCGNIKKFANMTEKDCGIQPGSYHRECNFTIWYRDWMNPQYELLQHSCEPQPNPLEDDDFNLGKQGQKTGVNVSDPGVYNASEFGVNYINYLNGYDDSGNTYREGLSEIDRATFQFVSGMLYDITVRIGITFCGNIKDFANATEKDCPLQPGCYRRECNFTIWSQPWMNSQYKMLNHSCEPKRPPCSYIEYSDTSGSNDVRIENQNVPPGGQVDVNVTDETVINNANFAVNYINFLSGYSGSTYRESLAEVDSGTVQVVDGSVYRLTIHIGTSFCTNNDLNANRTGCAIQPGLYHRECNVTTLYKEWMKFYLVLNMSCEPRQLPDQERQSVELNDVKVKNAAGYAVDEINRINGYSPFDDREMLAEIDGGTNEVLDGANYMLTIHIGPSICQNIPLFNHASSEQCPLRPGRQMMNTARPALDTPRPIGRRSLGIDPKDPFYIKGAKYAVNEINTKDDLTGYQYKFVLDKVINGTYLPYGYSRRIHLDIQIGDSNCEISDTESNNCQLRANARLRKCSVTLDYSFLMQRFRLTGHHCDV